MTAATRYVFYGDSITDAGRDRADDSSLGDGYVSLLDARLRQRDEAATVRNLGISGNRAKDLEARIADDLVPAGADVLTVFVGINDTWRRFDSADPTDDVEFERSYRAVLDAVPARTVLIEPFLLPVRGEQETWLEDLAGKRAVVRRLADEYGAVFVPLHSHLTAVASSHSGGPAALAPDGVHPTPLGAATIADAWTAAVGIH
ncbi:SGNH/GDSL hydrolase family protein [Microbacterium cremeum]|uniref:SGNH/GDSL hydrolase family protein n=1 Tax=Microbacterium cremeum TaxID=2782169 RepID=UPI001886FD4A|nr:SGNH/GDSL hydrolase family protein [Microbacterium cremeum]